MNKDFKETEIPDTIKLDDANNENKVRYALFSLKTQSERCELLINLISAIPTKLWFELAIGYIDEISVDNQKEICKQITAIFKEGELFSKKDSIEIFKWIERKAVLMDLNGTPLSKLIPYSASFFNKAIYDNRYKLFADYGYVYYTNDFDKLKSAVVELNDLYEKGGSPEVVRSYAYLLTVAQFRLARLLYPKNTIDKHSLSNAYEDCFDKYDESCDFKEFDDDGWYPSNSFGNNHINISNVPERITRCDCTEIARIFDPHIYYIDANLLKEIHRAVRDVSDRNKYENEIAPIVEKSCLFVISPDN